MIIVWVTSIQCYMLLRFTSVEAKYTDSHVTIGYMERHQLMMYLANSDVIDALPDIRQRYDITLVLLVVKETTTTALTIMKLRDDTTVAAQGACAVETVFAQSSAETGSARPVLTSTNTTTRMMSFATCTTRVLTSSYIWRTSPLALIAGTEPTSIAWIGGVTRVLISLRQQELPMSRKPLILNHCRLAQNKQKSTIAVGSRKRPATDKGWPDTFVSCHSTTFRWIHWRFSASLCLQLNYLHSWSWWQ